MGLETRVRKLESAQRQGASPHDEWIAYFEAKRDPERPEHAAVIRDFEARARGADLGALAALA